jgi:hypothetical protein
MFFTTLFCRGLIRETVAERWFEAQTAPRP